jgi:lysophospholipase L1-like esterase
MQATPNTGTTINTGYVTTSPEMVYNVDFVTTGTYYVWIRGYAGGGGADDSLHAGLDGAGPSSADRIYGFNNTWSWRRTTLDGPVATLVVSTTGRHTFHLWMREDGLRVDRIVLRTSGSSTAPADGLSESPHIVPTVDTTPPVISAITVASLTGSTTTVTWVTDEPATSQIEYGTTTSYGQLSPLDPTVVPGHSVRLEGLSPGILYHYRIRTSDGQDNLALSEDRTLTSPASDQPTSEVANGQVVIEAEHPDSNVPRGGQGWTFEAAGSGFSGSGYLKALPNIGTVVDTGYVGTMPELVYNVQFPGPGTYYLWIRGSADSGGDDSIHAGLDGVGPDTARKISGFNSTLWVWKQNMVGGIPATLTVPSAGLHTVHLWMREDGLRIDKILLRTSSSTTPPSGAGPSESSGKPRLMGVGDSITVGSADPDQFGYRDHLQRHRGIGLMEFVGTQQGPSSNTVYDVDHAGVSGERTDQVIARLAAALAAHMPVPNPAGSAILLHVGTNDITQGIAESVIVDNVEAIIDLIDAHDPSIDVHVALITPRTLPEFDAPTTSYNNALETRLLSLQATKSNLFIVDMNAAFKANPTWAADYMGDGVHPNDIGYQIMAVQWDASLDSAP